MAIIGKVLVLRREDLILEAQDKAFKDVRAFDLKFEYMNHGDKSFQWADVVIFVKNDGSTKLLKNRWGNDGFVNPVLQE
jgi:hypothetical protein